MEKRFELLMLIILVVSIIMFSGCVQEKREETLETTEEISSENSENDHESETISEQEEPKEEITKEPNAEETVSILPIKEYDTITDTGRFSHYQDDTHVVILISGVPEAKAEKVFLTDENTRDKIDEINPNEETVLKFEYYIDEDGENVILEITKK